MRPRWILPSVCGLQVDSHILAGKFKKSHLLSITNQMCPEAAQRAAMLASLEAAPLTHMSYEEWDAWFSAALNEHQDDAQPSTNEPSSWITKVGRWISSAKPTGMRAEQYSILGQLTGVLLQRRTTPHSPQRARDTALSLTCRPPTSRPRPALGNQKRSVGLLWIWVAIIQMRQHWVFRRGGRRPRPLC